MTYDIRSGRWPDPKPPFGRPCVLDHRVEKRPADVRSTEHWLVHPWGARSRGNGRQPEATGHRFHAQIDGHRVAERGGSPVQLPPRAREWLAPGLGSGASSISDRAAVRCSRLRVRLSPSLRRWASSVAWDSASQSPKSSESCPAITWRRLFVASASFRGPTAPRAASGPVGELRRCGGTWGPPR